MFVESSKYMAAARQFIDFWDNMGLDTTKCYYVSREMTIQLAAARLHQEMAISASRRKKFTK